MSALTITFTAEATQKLVADAVAHAYKCIRKDYYFCPSDGEYLENDGVVIEAFSEAVLKAANEKNISNPDEVGVGVDVWLSDIAMELMDEHSSHSHELPYE